MLPRYNNMMKVHLSTLLHLFSSFLSLYLFLLSIHQLRCCCAAFMDQKTMPSPDFRFWAHSQLTNFFRECPRQHTLTPQQLPVTAEIFVNGESVLGRILSWEAPKVMVQLFGKNENSTRKQTVVDFGQITTIWIDDTTQMSDEELAMESATSIQKQNNSSRLEAFLDLLYKERCSRRTGFTKQQIADRVAQLETMTHQSHAASMLRQVSKAGGMRLQRLVDSRQAADQCHLSRQQAARLLAEDAALCGRFKRWPCLWVGNNEDGDGIVFVNGGWVAADPGVRAGTEARKLVERLTVTSREKQTKVDRTIPSDLRILRRLECLAMGEIYQNNTIEKGRDKYKVELDLRETLNALQLDVSAQGARDALIRMNHWTYANTHARHRAEKVVEPWSTKVLTAAHWYATEGCNNSLSIRKDDRALVDLTHLPCLCVDAARATFRDDALGLRLRSNPSSASRWEILVHIADVSDLYGLFLNNSDIATGHLMTLRKAAQRRGVSRYDLPYGPLHLLPPKVLRTLAFDEKRRCHRCVTLWAYIDERTGELQDAGIERSMISSPTRLSFATATALLESGSPDESSLDGNTRSILLVIDRILHVWANNRRCTSESARQREQRLAAREVVDPLQSGRDDGKDGFRRSRGHKLVDAALDLYSLAAASLLEKSHAPVPRAPGAGSDRGGRLATAPLRRYIDGQAQRQLLAVVCGVGRPLTAAECKQVTKVSNEAQNAISNIRAKRKRN